MTLITPALIDDDPPKWPAIWIWKRVALWAAACLTVLAVVFLPWALFLLALTMQLGLEDVDRRYWVSTAETILGTPLPAGIVVENCAVEVAFQDGGPRVQLSGTPEAMAELIRRLPAHSRDDGEIDWPEYGRAWPSLPPHQRQCKLFRGERNGFIAYVSQPIAGRATMVAIGWQWRRGSPPH
jgi:hypothetical protein